jgi:acetyl esterase/lipase
MILRSCSNLLVGMALFALTGCTKFDALNAIVPAWGYSRTTDLTYGPAPRQTLDIYRPACTREPAPVVIFFYGGYWQYGNKADYRFVAQALTSKGFVAVLPDYRLYPQVTFPAFVQDGALVVRWAHDNASHFGGDPSRIYLMGHSAGAHIAALLTLDHHYLKDVGLDADTIRATAGLSGPYDFVPGTNSRAVFGMKESDTSPDPTIEPIHFADGHSPPMLLINGAEDQVVSPSNATRLAQRIRAAGGDARALIYCHLGHVGVPMALAWPFHWMAPVLEDVTTFFRRH